MRKQLFVAAAFLLLVSASTDLNAQNDTRKFSILITNASKQPIVNADVELVDNFGKVLTGKTDKDGIATFNIGPSENYTSGRARITNGPNRFDSPVFIHYRLNSLTIEMPDDMVIITDGWDDSKIFDTKKPTTNTEVTTDKNIYARSDFAIAVPEYGPYTAACDANPLASVPMYHDHAVESEKTVLDAISESCVAPADEAVNSLVDLTLSTVAVSNKLHAIFNEQTVKSNLVSGKLGEDVKKVVNEDGPKIKAAIADAIEKTTTLYEGMKKISKGPQLYVVDCIWDGLVKFYIPDDIMKVKKATENFGKAKEAMGEKLTALKARYDDGSRISFKDKKLFTDWSDITENTEKTVAGLKTLVGIASNPRKYFTSFESQATNVFETAGPLINNVVDDCKIIELDVKVKTGIEAGQAALAAKRKFAAQMAKAEGQWKDRINAISGTTPWYNSADSNQLLVADKKPVFVNEFQWAEYVNHHNDRINARKDVERIVELLSKLSALCSRTQSAANIINQKIEKYEQLYISGCEAADKCEFSNAYIIVSQLKEIEKTPCGHFYPRPFGFVKSDNLDKRITRNKEYCKTGVTEELPVDPSWVSTVLYKVYPECANKNDQRNTIEDVKVWMYFDGKRINATGASGFTMFPVGTHTLKIEVEPREGYATGNSTYLIKRVEWMRCAAGVSKEEVPLASETPNSKEVTMKVNIVKNDDKNHCYKAVIYIDKCGRNP